MNKKIKRYLDEIARTEKKIAELQSYLKGVRTALKAEEEVEMIKSIRSMKLNSQDLFELMNGIQAGTIIFTADEEPDSDKESGSYYDSEAFDGGKEQEYETNEADE